MKYLHSEDGITHINVYSKGQTELGRFLSNFAHTPIETVDGHFESIEGYWYWLGTDNPEKDKLRTLFGSEAKFVGRELRGLDWQESADFKDKILNAIKIKINQYPRLQNKLKENKLPLTHYYASKGKIINVPQAGWILEGIEKIKEILK